MQQSIQPIQTPVIGEVVVPGSKSISNRALLLAALAKGESVLSGVLFSEDTMAFLGGLQSLGVNLEVDQQRCQVKVQGSGGDFSQRQAAIYCHDAGTATRFLIPACAAVPGSYRFTASARMQQRPIGALLDVLSEQGAEFVFEGVNNQMPFTINSTGFSGGEVVVDISQSSQFLSGLLMAAPLAQAPMQLVTTGLTNKPYASMTQTMMASFGIESQTEATNILVNPGSYQACTYQIEPDASTASYFFAAAAISGGDVLVKNLRRQGLQGDTRFLEVLEQMGCRVIEESNGIRVIGGDNLTGFDFNMSGFSDTFMTVAAVAAFADKPMTLSGLTHTRLQESDRVAAMEAGLNCLGIKTETTEDSITIVPGSPHAGVIDSHNDHRIAMSLSLLGLKTTGVEINGSECVAKTCPDYFKLMGALVHG